MTDTKHTPGPWHRNIPPARKYTTIFAGRNTHVARLAVDDLTTDTELEANANLIAAAPDLLEALELAEAIIERFKLPEMLEGSADVIRVAIAKARGQS